MLVNRQIVIRQPIQKDKVYELYIINFNDFTPKFKKYILTTFKRAIVSWSSENWKYNNLASE